MTKKILLYALVGGTVVCGSGLAYASIFGEENVPLWRQVAELMGIHNTVRSSLHEARVTVDLARDAADDVRRAQALIEEVNAYSTEKFIEDFKRDVRQTYPDLDYIIEQTSADGLRRWEEANIASPMGSYELIGRVFGEVTKEMREAQKEGSISLEGPIQKRIEASLELATAKQADDFIDKADEDIGVLVEQLNGATKEEAIVLQAKIMGIVAAQNSHMLRLTARQVRRDGLEDARSYRGSMRSIQASSEASNTPASMAKTLKPGPAFLEFAALE